MSRHRFFVAPDSISGGYATLKGDVAHQLRHVLRLQVGDRVLLLDNSGWEFEVALESLARDEVVGRIVTRRQVTTEPQTRIVLYPALLKADRFEWVLQKCVELGVAAFQPVVAERCVLDEVGGRKWERWRRIVREAAEQSGRGIVPSLSEALAFEQALTQTKGLALIAYEEERARSLRDCLRGGVPPSAVSLFVGPEGGFSAGEVAQAHACGVVPVTLGPRVLRAETASVAMLTAVLHELGEMG